jgi:glycine cleavage system pyridoxal-binding protein P
LILIAGGRGSWTFIQKMVPFIGEETLNTLVDKAVDGDIELKELTELAPFLEEEAIERLLARIDPNKLSPEILAKLAPFMGGSSLGNMVKQLLKTK